MGKQRLEQREQGSTYKINKTNYFNDNSDRHKSNESGSSHFSSSAATVVLRTLQQQ